MAVAETVRSQPIRPKMMSRVATFADSHRGLSAISSYVATPIAGSLSGALAYHLLTNAHVLSDLGIVAGAGLALGAAVSKIASLTLDRARAEVLLGRFNAGFVAPKSMEEDKMQLRSLTEQKGRLSLEIRGLADQLRGASASEKVGLTPQLAARRASYQALVNDLAALECRLVRTSPLYKQRDLGEGGMGTVAIFMSDGLGREVVVKSVKHAVGEAVNEEAMLRLEAEATSQAEIVHPNVARVYAFSTIDGQPSIVQEFIEGKDLAKLLKVRGSFDLKTALIFAIQFAEGLKAAHDKNIIHRDLKPENAIVAGEKDLKIIDFGLAKKTATTGGSEKIQNLTTDGTVQGTPGYMAPEQITGKKDISKPADVFALGIIIHQMLTGIIPFSDTIEGDGAMAALVHYIQSYSQYTLPIIPELGVSHPLYKLLVRMTSHEQQSRPEIGTVLNELKKIASAV